MPDKIRRLLPLLGHSGGSRDAMTCLYRCGNACDHPVPNGTANPYLGDIVNTSQNARQAGQALAGISKPGGEHSQSAAAS